MSVANTLTQLKKILITIPEINTIPLTYPGSLHASDLPAIIIWPGRATTVPITARAQKQKVNRVYSLRVFVEASALDTYDNPAQTSIILLDKILDVLYANRILEDGYTEITSISDNGVNAGNNLQTTAALTYSGNYYKGLIIEINIVEVVQ